MSTVVDVAERNARAQPLIVCPLAFERRALLRAGLSARCRIMTCGPGSRAMRQWTESVVVTDQPVVILAGLAGSLHERCAPRSAQIVGAVLGNDGRRWEPSFTRPNGLAGEPTAVISSAPGTLTTPSAKRTWARRSGADLVDRESAVFAEAATQLGWRWAIVRGISDGVDDALPAQIDRWVDEAGHTRVVTVVAAMFSRPALIGEVRRLRTNSLAALEAVARLICTMLG